MSKTELPPLDIPGLLRRHDIRPKKSLGQNFLVEPNSLEKVVSAARLEGGDIVLEIGAGIGSLTRWLAVRASRVVAVELDEGLIPVLKEVIAGLPNVQVVQGDMLNLDPARLVPPSERGYVVVANIPYYITSALIRHLLEAGWRPRCMTLTVQYEVARRICAEAGEMSLLALSVQLYGKPALAARLPAQAFYPAPKVDSAVVRVELYDKPVIDNTAAFFRLAKAGFSQKRKTLRNALAGGLGWPAQQAERLIQLADLDPSRRAQTLTLGEWAKLVDALSVLPEQ